jgi:hypothetical protein
VLISVGTAVAFVALLSLPSVPVPIRPAWYLAALTLAVGLAAAAVWRTRRWVTLSALAVSVLVLALGSFFHFVAARVPGGPSGFVVGQTAPDFTLPDAAGRPVTLSDYRGKQPVVVVFYRGYW